MNLSVSYGLGGQIGRSRTEDGKKGNRKNKLEESGDCENSLTNSASIIAKKA